MEKAEIVIIGKARTPWRRREDTPHQPVASPQTQGTLEIDPAYAPGLADLEGFARIWVLFLFDRSKGWNLRVKPPRGGPRRGLFATRAPDRPASLGMTCVALRSVDVGAGRVVVEGIDLLDGTPVVDIKPYLPMVDAYPDAGHGWLEGFLAQGVEPALRKPYRPED